MVRKGFRNQVCHKVVYWAIENIWIKMGGGENSSSKLIGKIAAFCDNLSPYNDEFVPKYYTVERWWSYVEQDEGEENFIQQLALKIFSITPHNAGYMNVKNDEEFYQLVRNGIYQNINDEIGEEELDNEDDDYGDTEDKFVNIEEYEKFGHKMELLKLQEPRVVIEPVNVDHIVDYGNKNFDIEKLLDQQFSEDDDVNV
ncbi:unnamed protein product [Rhizophagus irregularis]|nr:unnamed protein product [Rhizophagus irregularis]